MWPKPTLAIKGLILACIPLIFELGFVFVLGNLQREAEDEARRAVEARDISDRVSKLTAAIYNVYTRVNYSAKALRENADNLDLSYRPALDEIAQQYKELDALTAKKPELNALVKQSALSVIETRQVLDSAVSEIKAGNVLNLLATHRARSERLKVLLNGVFARELLFVSKHEQEYANTSNLRQAAIRATVLQLAYCLLACNSIFTILLAMFFVKTVVKRLNTVTQNASLLAAGQSLAPPVGGSDEIAELDRAFHHMADELQQAAQAKEALAGMLTHDLRTPLSFIRGCVEMLLQGMFGEVNERGQKLFKMADRNSFQMMELISDLLDSQKIDAQMLVLDEQDVCVAELFEAVRLNFEAWLAEHGINLKIEDTDLFVRGDVEKLKKVLFNLVANAFKHSKNAGEIVLTARLIDSKSKADPSRVELAVADSGGGISEKDVANIFAKFQQGQSERKASGSGLGLFICKEIVELHGGAIWVTSNDDKGCIFHISLIAG